jgi:prolyl 4-hydroxylase
MLNSQIAAEFMQSAVSGVSKTQLIRTFKERHDLLDADIAQLLQLCNFKQKPNQIDYTKLAEIENLKDARRIYFPFTQLYAVDNFLSSPECNQLIELIDQNLRPSTVSDPKDECVISDYRTSKTADLHYFQNPFLLDIDRKITNFVGFSPFMGEMMQSQRYAPGEYYKEHYDFFSPLTPEYKVYCEWMGQRTWTTMLYLNDVTEGGETYFKHLKLKVRPKQGTLILWNNLYKNGIPNLKTMHEALPPLSGDKYVITKWWRSWPLI